MEQPSKLYSEILEKIKSSGDVLCYVEEEKRDAEIVDDFKYPDLAKSLEELSLERMSDFAEWSYSEYFYISNHRWADGMDSERAKIFTTKEILQEYLSQLP